MSPLSLKQSLVGSLLSALVVQTTASPLAAPAPLSKYADAVMRRRALLDIRATTVTNSSTIDWIPIESQGKIATPPPASIRGAKAAQKLANASPKPLSELQQPGAVKGPEGTVPIPHITAEYLSKVVKKQLPEREANEAAKKRQYAGTHWYVSSNQNVNNLGGSAAYSLYKAYVANSGDFSLLQTAITHGSSKGGQSLEIGWINYPDQIQQPHLFTYFTTDGYASYGDYAGGYNRDVAGWVQVDSEIFPGTVFGPLATDGGTQYEMTLEGYLYQGNWWVYALDRFIGYYPASIYSNGVSGASLAGGAEAIFYYGEIYQSEGPVTTTDMGSGRFANTGFGHSAYIRNMAFINTNGYLQDYTAGFWDNDANRYSHVNEVSSTGGWGSYVFLGGPGAGGVTGG